MKITIDTKEDKHEDIEKVLNILTNILARKDSVSSSSEQVDTSNMMSMFDSPQQQSEETKTESVPDTAPDFTSFLNLANNNREEKQEAEEEPKIQFF